MPLRLVGLVVLGFIVPLPVTLVMQGGLPLHLAVPHEDDEQGADDPQVDLLCLQGLTALGNGAYDKAIAAYTEAIGRAPRYSFAYLGRGDAYLAKGDYD